MKPRQALLIPVLVALLAKIYCAVTTLGTNDADAFYNFGRFIAEHGLLAQYHATAEFNHTPLIGWYCAAIYGLAHGIGFNWLLRLPGIIADVATIGVLARWTDAEKQPPVWALALFALSPVHFMISGFHGNFDSVLSLLLLLATRAGTRGHAGWCGLLFGLACQIKVIPLLVAPAFFFFWLHRGQARSFFLTATSTILLGWMIPLVALPGTFLHQVLGYNSNWGSWGLTWLLLITGQPSLTTVGFQHLSPTQLAIMSALKAIIVLSSLTIAWRRRALPAAEFPCTLLLIWAVFFVFAPGAGTQYLVWFTPFLLLYSARWFAAVTAATAVFLFVFYNTICGGLPWRHGVSTAELLPQWVAWSALPWLTLTLLLIALMLEQARQPALLPAPADDEAQCPS